MYYRATRVAQSDQEKPVPTIPPISIRQSALLVIDVQKSFAALPERWARRSNPDFESNLTRLIAETYLEYSTCPGLDLHDPQSRAERMVAKPFCEFAVFPLPPEFHT
ncbi:MAG: hypothetical protein HGA19_09420, partial [Oscillochloris sp.]|nr:hypothetical protein [Oscillochloris sp.]